MLIERSLRTGARVSWGILVALTASLAPACVDTGESPDIQDELTELESSLNTSFANGGFEAGLLPWVGSSTAVTVTTAEKHGGAQSARITQRASAPTRIGQGIAGLAGRTYSLSAWVKTSNITGGGCVASLAFRDGTGALLGERVEAPAVVGTTAWRSITMSPQLAPQGTALVGIRVECAAGNGTAWIDDVALTVGGAPPPPPPGGVYLHNGFEAGDLSGFRCSGNCPSVVGSPVASGRFAGSFDLTRSMPVPYRTEAVLTGAGDRFEFGKEYWMGFKYRYEDWDRDSSSDMAPFQIHERSVDWDPLCGYSSAWSAAPFFMATTNDEATFNTYLGKVAWKGPVQRNQWLTMTVHFVISGGADGLVEAWKDATKILRVTGKNANLVDRCNRPMPPTYLKVGIYKWPWKEGRPQTEASRRRLLLDDLRLATGPDRYSAVTP